MIKIQNEELSDIEGGGFSIGAILAIGGIVTFFIGIIDGYVRPLKCNK
jgi:hypothetical protein